MTITQAESGLGSTDYDALLTATANIVPQLTVLRQNPAFDTYLGRISRPTDTPFSVASDDTKLVRAYTDPAGELFTETYASGTWSAPQSLAVSQALIAPKVVKNGSTWEIYSVNSLGYIYRATSSDAVTWGTHVVYSSVNLVGTIFISVVLGTTPLVYAVVTGSNGTHSIVALNTTTSFDLGITWANKIYDFDAVDYAVQPDDTTGINSNTGERHCLVMSCLLPASYTYKTISGLPVKQALPAGGIISFIIRPPAGSRPAQSSRWYPVHIFDQWNTDIQSRTSARIMTTNSIFGVSNNRDTLWVTSVGFEGDQNDVDTSYSYRVASYYGSRDGKHWSQSQIVPLDVDTAGDGDFAGGAAIVKSGTKLYLVTPTALVSSEGCVEFYNTPEALTMDLTSRVLSYTSSTNMARSSDIVLDNRDGLLWTSFFVNPGVYTLIAKMNGVQVSVEEIDSIGPEAKASGHGFNENIHITTRDHMAWITDRVESAQAEQWDNQLAAMDTFTNINGQTDSGLAHVDTVKGNFGTTANTLIAKPKYSESIAFHTTGSGHISDGEIAAIFEIPIPTSHGGTNSTDSPTYAGVIFWAVDKDNLWACWYNYWSGKIEIVERADGVSTVRHQITPTSAFSTLALAGNRVGLLVDIRGATVNVYESVAIYSNIGARYDLSYIYTVAYGTPLLKGSFGVIACGFSDQDSGSIDEPLPIPLYPAFDFNNPDFYFPDTGLATADPALLGVPTGKIATFNGSELLLWDSTHVYYEKNFIALTTPVSVNITPSSLGGYTVKQCVLDPAFTNTTIPAYCLASNGTNSAVWYCPNIAAPGASGSWTKGADKAGIYDAIRATSTPGSIMIESSTGAPTAIPLPITFDFSVNDGGWTTDGGGIGFWDGAVWRGVPNPGSPAFSGISISLNFGGTVFVSTVRVLFHIPTASLPSTHYVYTDNNAQPLGGGTGGDHDVTVGMSDNTTGVRVVVNSFVDTNPTGLETISEIIITGTGNLMVGGDIAVATSTNHGTTWGSPQLAGTHTSISGFDVQPSSSNSFVGAANGVYRATTLGGAYASYYAPSNSAIPVCVIVPYFNWAGVSQVSAVYPDIIIGLDRADLSSSTLLWIDGGATAGTVHNITPVAGLVFSNSNAITISYNHHIMVFGKVAGVAKIYRSTDKGTTWSLVSSGGTPTFIRTRRQDTRAGAGPGTNKGQCFITNGGVPGYTSIWAASGFKPRTIPFSATGLETIW